MDEPIKTTGELVPYTHHPDGRRVDASAGVIPGIVSAYFKCNDCGTIFPYAKYWNSQDDCYEYAIRCNGQSITLCPWCREDSQPWTVGRGK